MSIRECSRGYERQTDAEDFIGERGFVKLISHLREMIDKRGWSLSWEHKPAGFTAIVIKFYANMVGKKQKTFYVRGEWISFDREAINKTFNLKEMKKSSKFKRLQKELGYQKIVDLITNRKGEWKSTKKNQFE